jgi:ABC-type multidrug transport system fused ATPase/permease subunit
MDEATNALDSHSEQIILRALESLGSTLTIIMVTHRLATIRNADQIIVLNDGRIVESGDWPSLMARNGTFAALAKLQSLDDDRGPVAGEGQRDIPLPLGSRSP